MTFFLTIWIPLLQVQHVVHAPASVGMWVGFSANLVLISGSWILFSLAQSFKSRTATEIPDRTPRAWIGIVGLVYLRSTAGTAPAWLAAQFFVFYLFGWGYFAAGLAPLFEVVPRLAATLETSMITCFVLLIYISGVCAAPGNRLQWTMFFMASGLAGASWVVAGSLRAFSWTWVRPSLPHRGVLEDCEFPVNSVNGHMKRESSGYCRRLHFMSF